MRFLENILVLKSNSKIQSLKFTSMKLSFNKKSMSIGTPTFLWMRAAMPINSGAADLSECLQILERVKSNDKSWVNEWMNKAKELQGKAEVYLNEGRMIRGRNAMLRASNYYRTAMIRCPSRSKLADELMTKSRESYIVALKHINSSVEFVKIPYGDHVLPAYYYNTGKPNTPTLIGANGGDSTNEEMFNLLGFTAIERGWNFLVYEGPGQATARQLNPGLHLQPNYEMVNGAVVDWLYSRPEVAKDKIALFGWSLSSNLVIRAAALDKRIAATISNGLIVDIYEAWYGIWPKWLQKAKPKHFDFVFHLLEKMSSQVRALTSIFYELLGANTPTEMIQAWKPFNVSQFAEKLTCPVLFIAGEAEYAEQSAGPLILSIAKFLKNVKSPAWFHDFGYEDGWSASHCQIGAQLALQELVYDWLDMVLVNPTKLAEQQEKWHDFSKINKYYGKMQEVKDIMSELRIRHF